MECWLFFSLLITVVSTSKFEFDILTHLLDRSRHHPSVLPVRHPNDSLLIKIHITLTNILDLNWNDYQLVWDPAEYGGLRSIRTPFKSIWIPDIVVYNDVRESSRSDVDNIIPATIFYDGNVTYSRPVVLKSSCSLDMTLFPWDVQLCSLNEADTVDLYKYEINNEWILEKMSIIEHRVTYLKADIYPDMTYWLVMRRKPLYYLFNLILPCACVMVLSLFVFYLPPESGEKVSLSVTSLLSLTFFLNMVAESTPTQSEVVPLLSQYFGACVIIMTLSTIFTIIVLRSHHNSSYDQDVPPLIKTVVFGFLAKVVFMSSTVKNTLNDKKTTPYRNDTPTHTVPVTPIDPTTLASEYARILRRISEITNEVECRLLHSVSTSGQNKTEWIMVAMVLDRCFLIIFVLATAIISLSILVATRKNIDIESLIY